MAFPTALTKDFLHALPEGLRLHAPHLGRSDAERSLAAGFGYGSFADLRAAVSEFPETRRFEPRRFSSVATSTGAMASGSPQAGSRSVCHALAGLSSARLGERGRSAFSNDELDGMARMLPLVANLAPARDGERRCSVQALAWVGSLMDVAAPTIPEGSVTLAAASLGASVDAESRTLGLSRASLAERWYGSWKARDLDRILADAPLGIALPAAIKASGILPDAFCEGTCMPFSALVSAARGRIEVPEGARADILVALTSKDSRGDVRAFFPEHVPEWFDHVRELNATLDFQRAHEREVGTVKAALRDAGMAREELAPFADALIGKRVLRGRSFGAGAATGMVADFFATRLRTSDLDIAWMLREGGHGTGLRDVLGFIQERVDAHDPEPTAPAS